MASSVSVTLAMAMIGDGYRYVGDLGSGGGGTVVLVEHLAMNRLVAVKALVTASSSALGRLRREGRVLAALDHPSILRVLRLVDDGSVVALVTEYLDGGNFEDALAEDRLPGRAVVEVLTRVGEALQAAHGAGVVHRDVKPSNVLLGRDGRAVLADFGLTRLGGEFRTQSGAITGTPMYMAPEQITDPDAEASMLDVYSFGALTYRALTGQPPFVATDLKTLADLHLTGRPRSPAMLRAGVPKAVCGVVLGMLEKRPRNRPDLREVLAALDRVDPAVWDEILPDARAIDARGPAAPAAAAEMSPTPTETGNDTATGGTKTDDAQVSAGTEFEADPQEAPDAVVAATRHMLISDGPAMALVQPVFVPKRQRRMLKQLLIVGASILVGLAIGLVVLMLV
ncbi:MAG: serine/threonine-protein kinase [Mycobacterium sp.]